MQQNRLERVWEFMKPEILRRWEKLTDDDLAATEGQYDLVVEVIRKTHFEGRSHLSLEGEIRDWLNERVYYYENRNESGGKR